MYMRHAMYATDGMGMAVGILLMLLILCLVMTGIGIASYVMTSLSLYTIANRRQIKNPWLAWIPLANYWIVGSIADDYDEQRGIKRKWRVALLTMALIFFGVFVAFYAVLIAWIVFMVVKSQYGYYVEPTMHGIFAIIIPIYLVLIVFAMLGMALQFCQVICIYKIFESTVPEKALKYILLYILVPLAGPICLMRSRKSGYAKSEMTIPDLPEENE